MQRGRRAVPTSTPMAHIVPAVAAVRPLAAALPMVPLAAAAAALPIVPFMALVALVAVVALAMPLVALASVATMSPAASAAAAAAATSLRAGGCPWPSWAPLMPPTTMVGRPLLLLLLLAWPTRWPLHLLRHAARAHGHRREGRRGVHGRAHTPCWAGARRHGHGHPLRHHVHLQQQQGRDGG
jgi:hypothetical protein